MVTIVRNRNYPYGIRLLVALERAALITDSEGKFPRDLVMGFISHGDLLLLTDDQYLALIELCEENNIAPMLAFTVISPLPVAN